MESKGGICKEDDLLTALSLSFSSEPSLSPLQRSPSPCPPFLQTSPPTHHSSALPIRYRQDASVAPSGSSRPRRSPTQAPKKGKSETIPVLFPWATDRRATVHSLDYLLSKNINIITGQVQCRRCEKVYEVKYNLVEKFNDVGRFIGKNKSDMHHRAPAIWMNPTLLNCNVCEQENCMKPLIAKKKKEINWLFLLLGQFLGFCTLNQLKYFCKHSKNHRTGAKDRVLYLTYLSLCKQLDPSGPFNVT